MYFRRDGRYESLLTVNLQVRNSMAQSEDQFNQELQAKGRLIDLYKVRKVVDTELGKHLRVPIVGEIRRL